MFILFLTSNKYSYMIMARTFVSMGDEKQEGAFMKKRTGTAYRIKSRFRFTLFVVLMLLTLVNGVNTLLGAYDASSMTVQEYMTVEVCYRDTLWDLARAYMPSDMNIRTAVHEICRVNETSADRLQPGQLLQIPLYQ